MIEYFPLFFWTLKAGLDAMWLVRSITAINLKTVADISLSWQWDNIQRKHFRDNK
jgi:hypothetical protein